MDDIIYKLPPLQMSDVMMANEIKDKIGWGQQQNKLEELFWSKGNNGQGNRIAVIDTGLPRHRDLPEAAFAHNCSNENTVDDLNGHSSHVGGTICAIENGFGVRGNATKAEVGYIKALDRKGSGASMSITRAIYKALDEKCNIISMSIGGAYDQLVDRACRDAVQAGVFVIAAIGNSGGKLNDDFGDYPGSLDQVVGVASYNQDGLISDFSSRSPKVDIAFPGEKIISCWLNNQYIEISGTSMATPFCTSVVALMRTAQAMGSGVAVRNNTELLTHLRNTAIDKGRPGFDPEWGWGVPDLAGFVGKPLSPAPPITPAVGNDKLRSLLGIFGNLFKGIRVKEATVDGKSGLFVYVD